MRETELKVTIRSEDNGQDVLKNITNIIEIKYPLSTVKVMSMVVTKG